MARHTYNGTKTMAIQALFSEEQANAVADFAKARDKSASALLREAVLYYMRTEARREKLLEIAI